MSDRATNSAYSGRHVESMCVAGSYSPILKTCLGRYIRHCFGDYYDTGPESIIRQVAREMHKTGLDVHMNDWLQLPGGRFDNEKYGLDVSPQHLRCGKLNGEA